MQLFGTYTTAQTSEEFAFCLWGEALPPQMVDRMRDFGRVDEENRIWIRRVNLAEAFIELNSLISMFSFEIDYWYSLFSWSKSLAVKGCFQPGLKKEGNLLFSKWMVEWDSFLVSEPLEEWVQKGSSVISDAQLVKHFVEDIVDSYVRFVINTKFSLKHSQLGKLLKFKPFYLHEEWIQRLCMEEYEPGEGKRWEELYVAYKDWRGESTDQENNPGRLCIRLEPLDSSSVWRIRFFWIDPSGRLLTWDLLDEYRSFFLKELANVVESFSIFQESSEFLPFHCLVNMDQAYQFLRDTAPKLRRQGYAVFIPSSMQRSKAVPYHLQVSLDSQDRTGNGELGLESLLSFDFRISIGNREISAEEWEQWTTAQTPFVQIEGDWFVLEQEELKRSVDWLKTYKKKKELTLRDAFHLYALNGDRDLVPLSIGDLNTTGWIDDCFKWLREGGKTEEYPVSRLFEGQLRAYQLVGMSWLIQLRKWHMGACLADDMGLGKTIQFLSYLAYCKEQGWLNDPFLLICPTSVLGNWQREIQRFVPGLSILVHHGSGRYMDEDFKREASRVDLVLTTYSLIQRDHSFLTSFVWEGVVLDEAQHIKNSSSLQSKAIRGLTARHRIALTGTPMENRLEELWSIFEFLNPGFLGSRTGFRRQFVQPIEKLGEKERMESLKKLVRPFLLRRSKSDPGVISDLPEKIETKEYCLLSTEQAVLYEKIVKELMEKEKKTHGFARKGLILSTILKLKQICNHPALVDADKGGTKASGKMNRLLDMVEEMLGENDQILIFTQFSKMGHILKRTLEEKFQVPIPFLHGGVPAKSREGLIQQFQEKDGTPILILSLKAGGVGLNLTRANRVIHFDRWWNPAVENQATDRAFRIGQTRTVHVHKFICMGTIEEKIDQMIERKQDLVSDIMGMGGNWITELGTDELKDLLSLHHQLIEEF